MLSAQTFSFKALETNGFSLAGLNLPLRTPFPLSVFHLISSVTRIFFHKLIKLLLECVMRVALLL
jgi:hypothetical protein